MKKLLFSMLAMIMVAVACDAQKFAHRAHFKNIYTTVDTLVLENVPTQNPTKDGSYLVSLSEERNFVIAYNNDRSKAIVLRGYPWAKKMEYAVKYDGRRIVLYFKDEHIYCGYVYDEKAKACKYFEAINEEEKEMLTKKLPFLKLWPTFTTQD